VCVEPSNSLEVKMVDDKWNPNSLKNKDDDDEMTKQNYRDCFCSDCYFCIYQLGLRYSCLQW